MEIYHIHHIVPRHAGGTDDPENLVRVTVEEHAELHFARYLQYGEMGDWMAYHSLSGQMENQEVILEKARLGGYVTSARHSNKMAEWGSKGGKSKSKARLQQLASLAESKKKPIVVQDPLGNEFTFSSTKEAAETLGLHRANLTSVLSGKRKSTGGYTAYRKH